MLDCLERRRIARHQVLHVAESLFHDHGPANSFGMAGCWIHRRHGKSGYGATMDPGTIPTTTYRFESMKEFAEACCG